MSVLTRHTLGSTLTARSASTINCPAPARCCHRHTEYLRASFALELDMNTHRTLLLGTAVLSPWQYRREVSALA
jgi:hypothetical protein